MSRLSIWAAAATAVAGFVLSAAETLPADNPYGICAHLDRESAPRELPLMREAGIGWVRTDFSWIGVERNPGTWDFAWLDALVAEAGRNDLAVLPILDYDTPWAKPAWKHLDEWSLYVKTVVGRYAKTLRYWEVWNEQNSQKFWRDKPDGKDYAVLLKRTHQEIKAIDPSLQVLYGGTSHVPIAFIEDSLKAGAGDYFDIINVHPYHWQGVPEEMIPELNELKTLMKKYGAGGKPVWITEVGWATAESETFLRDMLPSVLKKIDIDISQTTVAMLSDPESGLYGELNFDTALHLSGFRSVKSVCLRNLAALDVKMYPVLIPAIGEEFPGRWLPELVDYVRRGGTLLLPSGLPFYYDIEPGPGGISRKTQVNERYLAMFHIGWDAWWTNGGVPKQESYQKPSPEFSGKFELDFHPSGRFLHERNLRPGDRFIPVIEAGTDQYRGAVAGIYKLDSDLKGNIIVCTRMSLDSVSEESQAQLLARTYLIALANGVERIFWYKSRSRETRSNEREAHFGILRKNCEKKPAFAAYQTLISLCPPGSPAPRLDCFGNVYLAGWTRPDGVNTWAVWTPMYPQNVRLTVSGKITQAEDWLGRKLPVPGAEFTAGPGIIYLTGPEAVTIQMP